MLGVKLLAFTAKIINTVLIKFRRGAVQGKRYMLVHFITGSRNGQLDEFQGFFVRGQDELFQQMSQIKAMEEVRAVKEWAIANFPVAEPEMTALDWRILGALRKDALLPAGAIADKLNERTAAVEERLSYLKGLPLAFSIEPPNDKAWSFTEIHLDFHNTTFMERAAELAEIGKPFAAASNNKSGALMVEPESIEQLVSMIRAASQIEGVRVVDYAFCEDMLWTQPWLDAFIEERIAELS